MAIHTYLGKNGGSYEGQQERNGAKDRAPGGPAPEGGLGEEPRKEMKEEGEAEGVTSVASGVKKEGVTC